MYWQRREFPPKGRSETHLLLLNCGVLKLQPERFRQLQLHFLPLPSDSFIKDRSAECQPVAKGHCGRVRLPSV